MSMLEVDRQSSAAAVGRHVVGDLLRRTAARDPDKLAIVYRNLRQTYSELAATVNKTANAMTERGIAKGDRVALFSHNSYGFVVSFFALAQLGAITVPINFMLGAEEVAYILRHAEAKAMVAEDALVEIAEAAIVAADLDHGVGVRAVLSDEPGTKCRSGWESVHDWMAHPDESRSHAGIWDDDPVALTYTSGTESRPKGATLTSRGLLAQFASCIIDGEMVAADVEIHAMPLYHCAQLFCFLSPGLYLGASNIVLPRPDPAEILARIEAERVTKLFCPPTVWIGLLRHPDFDSRDLTSLQKGYYGASAMPIEVLGELAERLPGVRLFNFYGQTEMSPLATVLKPEDQVRKAGSAGRPAINVETIVVDENDEPVPRGTVGEIVHRSPHAMIGYWNDLERSAEAFRNGWFHSGDLGFFDGDGYLTVVDRKKDMIKTGGENVASREVEEAIYQHPGVQEVAVFGVPHPRWIEAVAAVVVRRVDSELSEAELIAFCRKRLAAFKAPKFVVFADELPKNASGKILKRELRQSHEGLATSASSPG